MLTTFTPFTIQRCALPSGALLSRYQQPGFYTDCYRTEINRSVTQAEYINAFFTTWLFKLERIILRWLIAKPSTDQQAMQLARAEVESFSAWELEARSDRQLLMTDFQGRTRCWLMVLPTDSDTDPDGSPKTQLFFGSAVVPRPNKKTKALTLGWSFVLLNGFHRLYSILLLYSAKMALR